MICQYQYHCHKTLLSSARVCRTCQEEKKRDTLKFQTIAPIYDTPQREAEGCILNIKHYSLLHTFILLSLRTAKRLYVQDTSVISYHFNKPEQTVVSQNVVSKMPSCMALNCMGRPSHYGLIVFGWTLNLSQLNSTRYTQFTQLHKYVSDRGLPLPCFLTTSPVFLSFVIKLSNPPFVQFLSLRKKEEDYVQIKYSDNASQCVHVLVLVINQSFTFARLCGTIFEAH